VVAAGLCGPSAQPKKTRRELRTCFSRTTKGLEVTQQQAVDQLQIVQEQLAAQQAETKKLSKQIATLTEKLDALQQSVTNIAALSVATPTSLPKAQPSKK